MKLFTLRRRISAAMFVLITGVFALPSAHADVVGSVFLTGHDPDFHAVAGNTIGAQHIIQDAIKFIMDPGFNAFVAGGNQHFLFVECQTCGVPGGHIDGVAGITASLGGFPVGTTFETHGATTGLAAELALLGTKYSGIVIGSDFGGLLSQAELDLLDADSAGIISFLNSGGGLFAMAETSAADGGLATHGYFGYLPFVVSSSPFNEAENGNTLTPFGTSLGLVNSDINGNFSHNVFTSTGGLNIVDHDAGGEILSLAGRGNVTPGGVGTIPEPSSILLLGSIAVCLGASLRKPGLKRARP